MKRLLFACAVVAMAVPAWAATDFFPVTADGSFDTYPTEGYTNGGATGSARFGYSKQGLGWMAWDGNDVNGVEHVSKGDSSGQTMSQFVTATGGSIVSATLWLQVDPNSATPGTLNGGSWGISSLRCGNQGVLQEDGNGVGNPYTSLPPNYAGSSQDTAFKAGAGPYSQQGILNSDDVPWVMAPPLAGQTQTKSFSHWRTPGQFFNGQAVQWPIFANNFGYDSTMQGNGGIPWALACLLGYTWGGQGSNNNSAFYNAGQIVNNDASGANAGASNPVILQASDYVGASPRASSQGTNWFAVPISIDLATNLAFDSADKGIVFNNWFGSCTTASGNPAFYTKDQSGGIYTAFLSITTPEPATLVLLALGGLALIRRRA